LAKGNEKTLVSGRKVFHVAVFSGAVPAQLFQGFWGVVVYGSIIALLVLGSYWAGPELPFHQALRGGQEAGSSSRRSVLLPLLSTAGGGLLSTLLVGNFAVVGYLVCGWGDGMGEPVGARWGRHLYTPILSRDRKATRSLEGSFAVFLAGTVGATLALGLLGYGLPVSLWTGMACGGIGAVAEGVSGSETDNLWVLVLPSLMAWMVLH
jgi:phytol kinase